jgi:hypothetical protein
MGSDPAAYSGTLRRVDYLRPRQILWRGSEDAPGGKDLVALLSEVACLDTMADSSEGGSFDFDARLSLPDGEFVTGCCRRQDD